MTAYKRASKILARTPLPAPRRPAEAARTTDRHIRNSLHPLAAAEATRQGVKPRKKVTAT